MKSSSPAATPKRVRIVERVAQKLYEQAHAGAKPWVRLGWDARETWLAKARESLDTPSSSFDWVHFWRSIWFSRDARHFEGR